MRRLGRGERGQSIVETALSLPILLAMLIGAFDAATVLLAGIVLQTAVLAGAQYGSLSSTNATNSTNIAAAVRTEAVLPGSSGSNPTVTSSTATDSAGETKVTVQATFTYTTVVPWPALPRTYSVTRTAVLQVRR